VRWNMSRHLPTGCLSQYNIVPEAGSSPLTIGTDDLNSFFQGGIGKVAIYDSLLPPSKIAAHFQAMTGKAPGGSCNGANGYCDLAATTPPVATGAGPPGH
jgi:hypothetical protein